MKSFIKYLAGVSALTALGASIYIMQDDKLRKKTGKKVIKAMNDAEDMVAKKMY